MIETIAKAVIEALVWALVIAAFEYTCEYVAYIAMTGRVLP